MKIATTMAILSIVAGATTVYIMPREFITTVLAYLLSLGIILGYAVVHIAKYITPRDLIATIAYAFVMLVLGTTLGGHLTIPGVVALWSGIVAVAEVFGAVLAALAQVATVMLRK